MIEEKTKQPPQPEPPKPPVRRGQKLRAYWAQVQCRNVLRKHRLRRTTQHRMGALSQALRANPAIAALGQVLYTLGFSTEYVFVRIGRRAARRAGLIAHGVREFLHELAVTAFPGAAQMFRELFGPIYIFIRGIFRLLIRARRIRKQQGLRAALQASGHYLCSGVKSNLKLVPRMAMYLLPLCALFGMVTVFRTVVEQPYALAVQVNGQTVGYVANEDVFNSAREAVQERINYAGTDKTEWTIEPSYTVSIAHDLLDENEMANAILAASGDEIAEGTALYLDGELTAVCADGTQLQSYLDSMLEPYEEQGDPNVTVGFNRQVELENGIYFNESFRDYQDIQTMLSGVQQQEKVYTVAAGDTIWGIAQKNGLTVKELCALNPSFKGAALTQDSSIKPGDQLIVTKEEAMLEVRISKTVTWQEEIAFTTETTKSNEYTVGTKKTTREGKNGVRQITARNVYDTGGVLLEQVILSTEVIEEPVSKQVVVGTKKVTAGTAYITGSGQFIWPVPNYRYCSRWYGGSHKGVDICAPAGTPIYATASGTVSKAGYNRAGAGSNYGYSVIINHAGGYSSVYAHCLSLTVSAGQSVKQGQLIGYVGSTGRSTGNHCHFEIRLNGTKLVIQNFFPKYR